VSVIAMTKRKIAIKGLTGAEMNKALALVRKSNATQCVRIFRLLADRIDHDFASDL